MKKKSKHKSELIDVADFQFMLQNIHLNIFFYFLVIIERKHDIRNFISYKISIFIILIK